MVSWANFITYTAISHSALELIIVSFLDTQ
jgi:hypothetical protein